jgi:tRNA-uridine 2-sulfurtransferase
VRVLVAMSGGVDSSVAAALLLAEGHDVVGVTMKLWGGPGDSGCCSVADVEDATRVADQLGMVHRVFNFTSEFETSVVGRYVSEHAAGRTPNPCIDCNRHLKFGRLLRRAEQLGFDAVATGHHARVERTARGYELRRGADAAKDQSYVLSVLTQSHLSRMMLPVGCLTKKEVRARASEMGLRTAAKPDSQEVCFVTSQGGRSRFLSERLRLHPGKVMSEDGRELGEVGAVELVTAGQRRGLGLAGGTEPVFVLDVDVAESTVTVGSARDLESPKVELEGISWVDEAPRSGAWLEAQTSAHGQPARGTLSGATLWWDRPRRRVAPGQTVALYRGDRVLGAGRAVRDTTERRGAKRGARGATGHVRGCGGGQEGR